MHRRVKRGALAAAVAVAAVMWPIPAPAVVPAGGSGPQTVLVAENERLAAFDMVGGAPTNGRSFLPESEWVNGPPCFIPGDAAHRFYEADDNPDVLFTDHDNVDGDANPFFGLFSRDGQKAFGTPGTGELAGKTLVDDSDNGALWIHGTDHDRTMLDPAGCVFDNNGDFIAVDVGESHLPMNLDGGTPGFVTIFFKSHDNTGTNFVASCILDPALSQPGFPAIDSDGSLLLPETGNATVWKYSNLPTNASECDSAHGVKSEWTNVLKTVVATPSALARDPHGGWALSSVLAPPMIVHLDDSGLLNGIVAVPGPLTGNPFGVAYDDDGNLFFADLGLTLFPGATEGNPSPTEPIGPGDEQGALRWVPAGGLPIPQLIEGGYDFPDGVTVVPTAWLAS
jgi:hypothetical protein